MSLLAPLGLLGLIGIIALIIIYIIKPNYQTKFLPSTFIWRKSLKYKRKKLPISKLRNILLFICQVAILAGAAFILAQPILGNAEDDTPSDVILVIDASASMQAENNAQTRLERAATQALADAKHAFANGKKVSVILASKKAEFLAQEATADSAETVYDILTNIIDFPEEVWSYGNPDIAGAMKMAEQITSVSADTQVNLYTDTNYLAPGEVKVYNVAEMTEWNAAILDVRAALVENLYRIEIDVACYGADARIAVTCDIFNSDGADTNLSVETDVYCSGDEISTIVLGYATDGMTDEEIDRITEQVYVTQYDQIFVHISEYDSLEMDNQFSLYGGRKQVIKVQYYSAQPNTYWRTALDVLADIQSDKFIIEVTEVNPILNQKPAVEGYDIYIFEHTALQTVPSDGLVIYSNPNKLPADAGVRLGGPLQGSGELYLSAAEQHPLMKNIQADKISVTAFTNVVGADGYTTLLTFNDEFPMLLVKEDVDQKIVLMPFSVHYSNLIALPEFALLLNNIAEHFFPQTIKDKFVYEPGDTVEVNSQANVLEVTGPETNITLEEFPSEIVIDQPGTYTMTQMAMSGETVIENIYVRIPATESDICLEEESLQNPYFFELPEDYYLDLLFYFALAVVMLLFIEWWLKSREQI
ncbi:MAG: VWA domain-containing protein [Clostridia bacterium]|nr:VWA domain-containing protein [Clostridia bacterium]